MPFAKDSRLVECDDLVNSSELFTSSFLCVFSCDAGAPSHFLTVGAPMQQRAREQEYFCTTRRILDNALGHTYSEPSSFYVQGPWY